MGRGGEDGSPECSYWRERKHTQQHRHNAHTHTQTQHTHPKKMFLRSQLTRVIHPGLFPEKTVIRPVKNLFAQFPGCDLTVLEEHPALIIFTRHDLRGMPLFYMSEEKG